MAIDSVGNFFVDIKEDFSKILNDKNTPKELQNQRISSLCFRIFGLIGIVFGVISTCVLATSFFLAPLTTTILMIATIATTLVSYDHIVIGCNKHKVVKDCEKVCSGNICNMVTGGFSLLRTGTRQISNGVPADYEGTIFYKPIYRMFNSRSTAQTA